MNPISPEAIGQIFKEARSFSAWMPQDVSDEMLHNIYDLVKLGPTSANSCPARFVFVRNGPEKEKLIGCLSPGNIEKVRTAPVTVVVAADEQFYDQLPKLYPPRPQFRELFASDKSLAETTRLRNSSLQGAYLILAARALGLDCGPMSGFDNKKLDEAFFAGTTWKSNFICSLGYGDRSKLQPRMPRLSFDEACKVV
jgi:3-hydroxypropanoate dehydrogenase